MCTDLKQLPNAANVSEGTVLQLLLTEAEFLYFCKGHINFFL